MSWKVKPLALRCKRSWQCTHQRACIQYCKNHRPVLTQFLSSFATQFSKHVKNKTCLLEFWFQRNQTEFCEENKIKMNNNLVFPFRIFFLTLWKPASHFWQKHHNFFIRFLWKQSIKCIILPKWLYLVLRVFQQLKINTKCLYFFVQIFTLGLFPAPTTFSLTSCLSPLSYQLM